MAEKINIGKFINNLDTEDLTSDKLQGVVNNVYAKAITQHKKADKQVEDNFKEKDKETTEFVKSNHDRLKANKEKVAKEINEGFANLSNKEKIDYVIDNYKKITGRNISGVYTKSVGEDENVPLFDQDYIDATADRMEKFLKKNGMSSKEIDDFYYDLDAELASRYNELSARKPKGKVNEAEEERDTHWDKVKKFQKGDRRDKDSVLKDLGYDKEDRERLQKKVNEDFDTETKQGQKIIKMFKDLDDGRIHIIGKKNSQWEPFFIGLGYDFRDGTWGQGVYDFETAEEAEEWLKGPNHYRKSGYKVRPFVKAAGAPAQQQLESKKSVNEKKRSKKELDAENLDFEYTVRNAQGDVINGFAKKSEAIKCAKSNPDAKWVEYEEFDKDTGESQYSEVIWGDISETKQTRRLGKELKEAKIEDTRKQIKNNPKILKKLGLTAKEIDKLSDKELRKVLNDHGYSEITSIDGRKLESKKLRESAVEFVEKDRETGELIYKVEDSGKFIANHLGKSVSGKTIEEVRDKLHKIDDEHIKHFRNLPESKKLRESEGEVNPSNIYSILVKELPAKDIDHHESDLYVRKTPKSTEIINKLNNKSLLSTFRDQIDNDIWYDLPFCYTPFWDKAGEWEESLKLKESSRALPRSATKVKLGNDVFVKDNLGWRKEKSPYGFANYVDLRSFIKNRPDDDLEIIETDKDWRTPKKLTPTAKELEDELDNKSFVSSCYVENKNTLIVTGAWKSSGRAANSCYVDLRHFLTTYLGHDDFDVKVLKEESRDGGKEFAYKMKVILKYINTNESLREDLQSVDMDKFHKKYSDNYEFLYNNRNVAGEDEAVDFFDQWIKDEKHKEFMQRFFEVHHDFISSDREAAAFAFTLEDFDLLDESLKLTEADDGNMTIETSTSILDMFYPTLYETADDFYIDDYKRLDEILADVSMKCVEEAFEEVFPNATFKFKEVKHPREYNFSGENIIFDVTLPKADYEKVKEEVMRDPGFKKFLSKNSPRDGYIPFGAYDLDRFETQDPMYSIGQIVKYKADKEDLDGQWFEDFRDELYNNFTTYDDLWEETMEWLEDHEQAYQDFLTHFNANESSVIDLDSIFDWISEHDTLAQDFENAFGIHLGESLKESDASDFPSVKNNAIKAAKRDGYDQIVTLDDDGFYTIHRDYPNNKFDGKIVGRTKTSWDRGVQNVRFIKESLEESLHDGDTFEFFGLQFSLLFLDHTGDEPDEYAIVCDSIPDPYDNEPIWIGKTVSENATEKEIRKLCVDWIYDQPDKTLLTFSSKQEDDALEDEWFAMNGDVALAFVENNDPQYIADLIYNGDVEQCLQNTGKQVALDLYHQLGVEGFQKEIGNWVDWDETYKWESFKIRKRKSLKESQTQEIEKIMNSLKRDFGPEIEAKMDEFVNSPENTKVWKAGYKIVPTKEVEKKYDIHYVNGEPQSATLKDKTNNSRDMFLLYGPTIDYKEIFYTENGWKKFEKWLNKQGVFDKSTHFAITYTDNWPLGPNDYWTTPTGRFNTLEVAKKFADKNYKSKAVVMIEDDRRSYLPAYGESIRFYDTWMTEQAFQKIRDSEQ